MFASTLKPRSQVKQQIRIKYSTDTQNAGKYGIDYMMFALQFNPNTSGSSTEERWSTNILYSSNVLHAGIL